MQIGTEVFRQTVTLGSFSFEGITGSPFAQQLIPGDFNGDGRLDFLAVATDGLGDSPMSLRFLIGDGQGGWADQTAQLLPGGSSVVYSPRSFVGDLNGDGRDDILLVDGGPDVFPSTGGISGILLSQGAGYVYRELLPSTSQVWHGGALADIDGDGDLDMITVAFNAQGIGGGGGIDPVLLWMNDGAGTFVQELTRLPQDYRQPVDGWNGYSWVHFADVTGDGHDDLIMGTFNANSGNDQPSKVFVNDGAGNFTGSPGIPLPRTPMFGEHIVDIDTIDLNGDGLLDLIVSATPGGSADSGNFYNKGYIQLLLNQGGGVFTDVTAQRYAQDTASDGAWWKFVTVIDLNGDGHDDIVLSGAGPRSFDGSEAAKILLNDGTGHFSDSYFLPGPFASGEAVYSGLVPETLLPVDVNGDGRSDLIALQRVAGLEFNLVAFLHDIPYVISGNGRIEGTADADSIRGGAGNDTILPGDGDDTVFAGDGHDFIDLRGTTGNNSVNGGNQGDTILGGSGNDELRGGKGLDSIDGGAGNDTIYSGLGADTLTGGSGADVFVLRGFDARFPDALLAPTVTDFEAGIDKIAIQGVDDAQIAAALAAQTQLSGGVQFSIAGAVITVQGVNSLAASDVGTAADLGV